jgi:hypothetical protein
LRAGSLRFLFWWFTGRYASPTTATVETARGLEAHIQLRTAIGDAGGRLESPSIEFGEDSDSQLIENLPASVSQHQRQKNAEQVKNRLRARLINGYYTFAAPKGYRYRKSIRKERMEGEIEGIVRSLRPIPSMFYLTLDTMREALGRPYSQNRRTAGRYESGTSAC